MSRIFDALKQSDGARSVALVQMIEEGHEHATLLSPDEPEADFEDLLDDAATDPGTIDGEERAAIAIDSYRPESEESPVPVPQMVSLKIPAGAPLFPFDGSDPRASEQYRILRTNLAQHELKPKIIGISSASPGDGKTVTAINVAGILALKGQADVLLVDADLRHCSIAKTLGIPPGPGLTDVILGECTFEQAAVRVERLPSLRILPAGNSSRNPSELLDSPAFARQVDDFRKQFAYVIFDTTPMTAVTDFKLVQQICDGVIVVTRPDHTSRPSIMSAMQVLKKDKFLGFVINAVDDWFLWRSNEHYRYYAVPGGRRPLGVTEKK